MEMDDNAIDHQRFAIKLSALQYVFEAILAANYVSAGLRPEQCEEDGSRVADHARSARPNLARRSSHIENLDADAVVASLVAKEVEHIYGNAAARMRES